MSSIASSECENEPAIPWQVELNIFVFMINNYYYLGKGSNNQNGNLRWFLL